MITLKTACRVCSAPLDDLLSLGQPVLSDFLKPDEPDPPRAPLDLTICQACDLVQLRHTVDPNLLYTPRYWYRSGLNETMRAELQDIVKAASQIVPIVPWSTVLDVGANDGTLLECYWNQPTRIAVEPSQTFASLLHQQFEAVYTGFFPEATRELQPASIDILTSIACFYDADDPKAWVREVDRLLKPTGLWIVQMQDLGQMIQATAFDNICHEHLCYYSTRTFRRLLAGTNLCVTGVEQRPVNGGSLRFYLQRLNHTQVNDTERRITREDLDQFAWRVDQYREQLQATLAQLQAHGHQVDLYGASTKASTLLQACGIDHTQIRHAVERSPDKWGRVTSGTRIPIVSEDWWRETPAPATLLGIWQFREAVLKREAAYLERGGIFLIPLPRMEVVGQLAGKGVYGESA